MNLPVAMSVKNSYSCNITCTQKGLFHFECQNSKGQTFRFEYLNKAILEKDDPRRKLKIDQSFSGDELTILNDFLKYMENSTSDDA